MNHRALFTAILYSIQYGVQNKRHVERKHEIDPSTSYVGEGLPFSRSSGRLGVIVLVK